MNKEIKKNIYILGGEGEGGEGNTILPKNGSGSL